MFQYIDAVGNPVDESLNEYLNSTIPKRYAKLYNQCIGALERVFKDFNKNICSKCDDEHWISIGKYKLKSNCGCCVSCNGERGYLNNSSFEKSVCKDYKILYDSQWGFFNNNDYTCKLPRHLRSVVCLRYVCLDHRENISNFDRIFKLSEGISRIRKNEDMYLFEMDDLNKIIETDGTGA